MLALGLSACVCDAPPIDLPDGGEQRDGGASDGGPLPGTCVPSQCAVVDAGAGCLPSCIAESCVTECPGTRSCEVLDAGRCLACAGAEVRCAPGSCPPRTHCTFTIEQSSCTGLLDDGVRGSVEVLADCRHVMTTDAGVLGAWFELDTGEAIANVPRLGGYCIARDLFTGAPRTKFYCPFCSFVTLGCD